MKRLSYRAPAFGCCAAILLSVALPLGAAAQSRYQEPGREPLFPKNFGYKDDRPPLFPKNYGYRHEKPAPAEKWENPYKLDREKRAGGLGLHKGTNDVTGFKREPLGGGSWMDRAR
jgi:hypothetical protein